MHPLILTLISLPAVLLMAGWAFRASFLDRYPDAVAKTVTGLVAALFGGSLLLLAVSTLAGLNRSATQLSWSGGPGDLCIAYYDGVSGLGVLLVSFVGLVVCQYSRRYLGGDPRQGDYFRWTGATIGGVALAMLAGNLLLLFAAWVATSLSLHRLLLHYPERRGARQAAWTKFAVSRVGDCVLLAALALLYWEFGTLNLAGIFEGVSGGPLSPERAGAVSVIGGLLAVGAITKSAQFPFHSWLPQTLETPTPVSALMHAGIVNAGGYLVIRVSPVIAHASAALNLLLIVGATTVLVAGLSMATQSSVKRTLAYSTVAQMGFMMLQCGLGAFTAAMLHLVAHSLYKAYAFLNSGNVLVEARASSTTGPDPITGSGSWAAIPMAAVGSLAAVALTLWLSGVDLATKPGGIALAAVLSMALAAGLLEVLSARKTRLSIRAVPIAVLLSGLYLAAYATIGGIVSANVAHLDDARVTASLLVAGLFLCLFAVQALSTSGAAKRWLEPLYVHALNGFYIDSVIRRGAKKLRAV